MRYFIIGWLLLNKQNGRLPFGSGAQAMEFSFWENHKISNVIIEMQTLKIDSQCHSSSKIEHDVNGDGQHG